MDRADARVVTASAVSLPRGARLSRAYHITTRDPVTAFAIARGTAPTQGGSPLFPGFKHHNGRSSLVLDTAAEWQEAQYSGHESVLQKRAERAGRTATLQSKAITYDRKRLAVGDTTMSGKRVLISGFPSREPKASERTVREYVTKEILGREEVGVAGSETGLVPGLESIIPLPA